MQLTSLIAPLLLLSREAGQRICHHYNSPEKTRVQAKGDDSPLTQADLDSHHILERGLRELTRDIPVLSEESPEQLKSQRHQWQRLWMVDPLDGTKEFVARTGEFTINIALIEQHKPVLGLLYLPLEQVAFVGIPGQLSRRYRWYKGSWQHSDTHIRPLLAGRALTVLASRRHGGGELDDCLDWLQQAWGDIERCNSGSAIKFCQMVEGRGDFYPRFSPCCEWDTAAGQAVLEAAGGALLGLDGEPLRYNARDTLLSPQFYALSDREHSLWHNLLHRKQVLN
jgi:3'(2'), 5'-bisphosphate nucleotidase